MSYAKQGGKMCSINISITNCSEGDILAEDIYSKNGRSLIVAKGIEFNRYTLGRLADMGINEVRIYRSKEDEGNSGWPEFRSTYKRIAMLTKSVFQDMISGKTIDRLRISVISEQLYQSIYEDDRIADCIHELRLKDEYTYHHSINVAFYAMLLAKWLKLTKDEIIKVIQAGLLHDIGKIMVSGSILNKAEALTNEEFEAVKKHTLYGFEIVKSLDYLEKDIKKAILLHHERLDGSGYPFRYTYKEINLYARIVAIADVFDAMTSERIYKKRSTPFEVFKMFLSEGIGMFDHGIVDLFMKKMSNCLIGSKVQLSDGTVGDIVYIPYHNITDPVVRVGDEYVDLARVNHLTIVNML